MTYKTSIKGTSFWYNESIKNGKINVERFIQDGN